MNLYKIWPAILFTLVVTTLYAQNDSTVAVTELNRMNAIFGHQIKMNVSRDGVISSMPNQEIRMSLNELKRISSITKRNIRFYIVRFIVAHEAAHQMQYNYYGSDKRFMNNDLISRTIIETQADIMAGLIFFQLSPELFIYLDSQPKFVDEVFKEVFHVAFSMGITENTLGTHPSKRDRMLAIRIGMTNGFSFVFDQWVKSDMVRAKHLGITPEKFKNTMEAQFRFIDLIAGEDMMQWSYRQAKKIINYDQKVATGIVLTTPDDKRTKFHTQSDYPYVDYDLTYKNVSSKSTDVEMEVFVAHVKRIPQPNEESYRKVNTDHYKFTLAPGENRRVHGKLMWLKHKNDIKGEYELSDDAKPVIVYPGINSRDAIYSCSYTNDVSEKVYQENVKEFHFDYSDKAFSFSLYLNAATNACQQRDKNILKGIGNVNTKYPDELTYFSSIQLDQETNTYATIDSSQEISIEMQTANFYPDENKLHKNFATIKTQLDRLENVKKEEHSNGNWRMIDYAGETYSVTLQMTKDNFNKEYSIKMSVWPE
jgi:hypothetical protein